MKNSTQSIFEAIRDLISTTVPFAAHNGIEVTALSDGFAEARLSHSKPSSNHIGSQHAGALFAVGEVASGAAMAGAFSAVLPSVTPVAATANIQFCKLAQGTITAIASTTRPSKQLRAELSTDSKVAFDVDVRLLNDENNLVGTMSVNWNLRVNPETGRKKSY